MLVACLKCCLSEGNGCQHFFFRNCCIVIQLFRIEVNYDLRPPLPVLYPRVRPLLEQELHTVCVAEGDGVEECRAAVVLERVDGRAAEHDEGLDAVVVAAAGRAVERRQAVLVDALHVRAGVHQAQDGLRAAWKVPIWWGSLHVLG